MDKFQWIKNHFENRKEVYEWNSLNDIIPNIFDDYFLIHWKVGIIEDFPFEDYPEQNETIEQINKRIKIERNFDLFLNPDKENLFKEVNLNYISKKFNTQLNYKILNNIKETPAVEILHKKSVKALATSIKKISEHQSLNLFIEDAYRFPFEKEPKQEYNGISIEEYIELQENLSFDYSTYLFPDNLDWCLTTSEDLPMFLCIKKEILEKIKTFELEIFKIDYKQKLY